MTKLKALKIVYDLAQQNELDFADAQADDIMDEYNRQQSALDIVDTLIEKMGKK